MNKLEEVLNENDSTKRMLYTGITGLAVALGGKYGISENLIMAFIAFMGSVIAGSNYHAAAKAAGQAAADKVTDATTAVEAMGAGKVVGQ